MARGCGQWHSVHRHYQRVLTQFFFAIIIACPVPPYGDYFYFFAVCGEGGGVVTVMVLFVQTRYHTTEQGASARGCVVNNLPAPQQAFLFNSRSR